MQVPISKLVAAHRPGHRTPATTRLFPHERQALVRAAHLRGETTSEFMRSVLVRASNKAISRARVATKG